MKLAGLQGGLPQGLRPGYCGCLLLLQVVQYWPPTVTILIQVESNSMVMPSCDTDTFVVPLSQSALQ